MPKWREERILEKSKNKECVTRAQSIKKMERKKTITEEGGGGGGDIRKKKRGGEIRGGETFYSVPLNRTKNSSEKLGGH